MERARAARRVLVYAPDRMAERPIAHLKGFGGVLLVDGYVGYRLGGDVRLAFCWSDVRQRFYELAAAGPGPIRARWPPAPQPDVTQQTARRAANSPRSRSQR